MQELGTKEVKQIEGGVFFIPLLAVYGAAACLSACGVTLALGAGYYNNK